MNYLYVVKCGRYDYTHTMFITSDHIAAHNFIEKYNEQFSKYKFEDYCEHTAYIETVSDYVPELEEDYYTCNTTVYCIPANKDKNVQESEIRGYPISDYIDFKGNSNEIFGNNNAELLLDELLAKRQLTLETRTGYVVLIVVVDKGMTPLHDIVFNDWISEDLKQNLICKANELLKFLT